MQNQIFLIGRGNHPETEGKGEHNILMVQWGFLLQIDHGFIRHTCEFVCETEGFAFNLGSLLRPMHLKACTSHFCASKNQQKVSSIEEKRTQAELSGFQTLTSMSCLQVLSSDGLQGISKTLFFRVSCWCRWTASFVVMNYLTLTSCTYKYYLMQACYGI